MRDTGRAVRPRLHRGNVPKRTPTGGVCIHQHHMARSESSRLRSLPAHHVQVRTEDLAARPRGAAKSSAPLAQAHALRSHVNVEQAAGPSRSAHWWLPPGEPARRMCRPPATAAASTHTSAAIARAVSARPLAYPDSSGCNCSVSGSSAATHQGRDGCMPQGHARWAAGRVSASR